MGERVCAIRGWGWEEGREWAVGVWFMMMEAYEGFAGLVCFFGEDAGGVGLGCGV